MQNKVIEEKTKIFYLYFTIDYTALVYLRGMTQRIVNNK